MGKKIGQVNIDPESDKGFVQKEHWEKNFVCAQDFLTLIGTRLNLIANATATAKSLQSCPTLCDPIDGSPPGPLSLGFSRQEHWSGLPFPSPMHEGEK